MELKFRIFRYDPEIDSQPYYREYFIEAKRTERVLDCLNRIKWTKDGSLSYRMSCAHGVCGSDAMRINGKCALACQKLVKDFETNEIIVEPLPSFKPLKDLIVDMTPFFDRVAEIRPYLLASDAPEKERLQSPEDRKKMDLAIRCILCACCSASCPVVNENDEFKGPAPLVQAFRRIFDSRDEQKHERMVQLNNPGGVWGCVNHFECTRACPKEIPVTKCINLIKAEIKKTL
ncbi:MAG: succinate dehydrogenase/fumarate reductase iron-sulfur subunit [Desulfomonilaceae bacterium]